MTTKKTAAVAGVACAAVVLGTAELAAVAIAAASAPVVAVGAVVIEATPESVKEFAIAVFGVYDKIALIAGIGMIVAAVAVALGIASHRRIWIGFAGLTLFGLIGVVAAVSRTGASLWWAAPSVAGTACGAFALWMMFRRPKETDAEQVPGRSVDRRNVLFAFGAAGLTGAVGWRLGGTDDIESARNAIELPKAASVGPIGDDKALDVGGLTPYKTSNASFYRVDTVLTFPRLDPGDYELTVAGRVGNPVTLSYQDLLDRPLMERDLTISCVSNQVGGNLAGNARWLGVSLKELLKEVEPRDGADQVVGTSADGWTCGTPTDVCMDGRDAMLAVGMNGEPLPIKHGFPVRMIVPGLYGYVSATKWLTKLELSSFDDFDPYWVKRDWDAEAPIKTFSRIDTPSPTDRVKAGRNAVAGVAWAQQRGISKVEVQVDDGEWQSAELANVVNSDVWRQWMWEWNAKPGSHTLRVRATDGTGATQPKERRKPFPNGATGWHSVVVTAE